MNPAIFDALFVGKIQISLTDSAVLTADGAVQTFSAKAFGAATVNRKIVAAWVVNRASAETLTSVTIGGVTATNDVTIADVNGGGQFCGISSATVPTGTTGDIVITMSGSVQNAGVAVYRLIDAGAVYNTATDNVSTADAMQANINIPAGGCAIAIAGFDGSVAARTCVWTNLTEDVDTTVEGTNTISTASQTFDVAQTSLSITAQASGALAGTNGSFSSFAVASWSPT